MYKIAYIIYSLSNSAGMERSLTMRANFLSGIYDITIITQVGGRDFFTLDDRIHRIDLGLDPSLDKTGMKRECFKKISIVLCEYKFDVVVSLGGMELFFLYKIPDGSKKVVEFRFSYDFHKVLALEKYKGILGRIIGLCYTWRRNIYARKYDYIVTLSQRDLSLWKRVVSNVVQIYNPLTVSSPVISNCKKKNVIAVGRLEYVKGFDILIRSWGQLTPKHPDWTLTIFGEGSKRDELQNLIVELNLSKCILLKGISNNIVSEYANSSIFVLSSREEGFGLVITEAEVCGLPIITFNCPNGPGEIVEDGVNGIVINDVGSVDKLSKSICTLIEDEGQRCKMGEASLAVAKSFTEEIIKPQWVKLFNGLIMDKINS